MRQVKEIDRSGSLSKQQVKENLKTGTYDKHENRVSSSIKQMNDAKILKTRY